MPKVNVRPLNEKILVKRVEAEEKTKGGIVLPDTAKEKPKEGVVVSVGAGKILESGGRAEPQVKENDRVIFSSYAGTEVKIEDEEYLIMSEDDGLTWRIATTADFVAGLIPSVLLGDANNDGVVTTDDLVAVQQFYGTTGRTDGLLLGDANDDGAVTADDLIAVQQFFGTTLAPGLPIPEAKTVALLAGLVVLRRRVQWRR